MSERQCGACGQANAEDAQYCRACGEPLPASSPVVPSDTAATRRAPADQLTDTAATGASRQTASTTARRAAAASSPAARRRIGRTAAGFAVLAVIAVGAGWGAWHLFGGADSITLAQLATQKRDAETQLAQTQALTTEKDSLLAELLETTTVLSDINAAVTAVQQGRNSPAFAEAGGRPLTAREARAILMPRIDSLRARLNTTESRLGASLRRVHELTSTEARLRQQIAEYERTVASVRTVVADQQAQLDALGTELTSLRAENQRLRDTQQVLVATQGVLQDSVGNLTQVANTVYWVAGSKAALLELGVVVEEGSGKFLMFGKGKNVAVARSFHATDFTAGDKRQTASITLPKPTQRYRILTRQNLSAVRNALDKDGHVRGTIEIADPDAFWAASRYLVLIED